jgi:hypothetical protein
LGRGDLPPKPKSNLPLIQRHATAAGDSALLQFFYMDYAATLLFTSAFELLVIQFTFTLLCI